MRNEEKSMEIWRKLNTRKKNGVGVAYLSAMASRILIGGINVGIVAGSIAYQQLNAMPSISQWQHGAKAEASLIAGGIAAAASGRHRNSSARQYGENDGNVGISIMASSRNVASAMAA